MGDLRRWGRQLEEATGKRHGWNEILRACDGNEGIAYVVQGTLDGIAAKKKPSEAFFDAVEDQNFYGDRPDVVQARNQALRILEKHFGVKTPYVGEGLDEAVKRQGQVLPTENEAWGFYGVMASHRNNYDPEEKGMMTSDVWRVVFGLIMNLYPGIPSSAIREFLDAKDGRHLADSVTDNLGNKPVEKARLEKAVRAVFASANDGNYFRMQLARLGKVPAPEAANGSTASLVGIMKAANAAWEAVRTEEAKRNWKQQGQAMHALERAADALVDGVRAWFTTSGRAQTYPVHAGAGKQVRVTIPEGASDPGAPPVVEEK